MVAERWGGGRPDGGAVFKVGTNKRDIELDDSRGGGMGMKMPEDETQDATGYNRLRICGGPRRG